MPVESHSLAVRPSRGAAIDGSRRAQASSDAGGGCYGGRRASRVDYDAGGPLQQGNGLPTVAAGARTVRDPVDGGGGPAQSVPLVEVAVRGRASTVNIILVLVVVITVDGVTAACGRNDGGGAGVVLQSGDAASLHLPAAEAGKATLLASTRSGGA